MQLQTLTTGTFQWTIRLWDKAMGSAWRLLQKVGRLLFPLLPKSAKARLKTAWDTLHTPEYEFPLQMWENSRDIIHLIILSSICINIFALVFPLTLLQFYDRIIPQESYASMWMLVFIAGISIIMESILRIVRAYLSNWGDARFEHNLNVKIYDRLIHSQLNDMREEGPGSLLERINSVNEIKNVYLGQTIVTLVDFGFLFLYLFLILYIGGPLVLVPIILFLVFFKILIKSEAEQRPKVIERREQNDRRMNFIIEALGKIHTVKSTGMEEMVLRRYERLQTTNSVNNYLSSLYENDRSRAGFLFSQLTIIMIVTVGSHFVIQHQLTIGGLVACTLLAGRCTGPMDAAIRLWTRIQSLKTSQKNLLALVHMPREFPKNLPQFGPIEGRVEFRTVALMDGSDQCLVSNLSFYCKPKQMIAITGNSSKRLGLIFDHILGISKPCRGYVLVDEKDIRQYNLLDYRKQVAYLPRQAVMFNGTIIENLTLFDNNKVDTVLAVSKNIGLSAFVNNLPNGFNTKIGDQATDPLPHGIRQLIGIVRALRHRPKIVLFDEANTSMDFGLDNHVRDILNKIKGQYSIIMLTFRPSYIDMADHIYQVDDPEDNS